MYYKHNKFALKGVKFGGGFWQQNFILYKLDIAENFEAKGTSRGLQERVKIRRDFEGDFRDFLDLNTQVEGFIFEMASGQH